MPKRVRSRISTGRRFAPLQPALVLAAFAATVILIALPTDSAVAVDGANAVVATPTPAPLAPAPAPAPAPPAPAPAPPAPAPPAPSVPPIPPPTITSPEAGSFVSSGSVTVTGTRGAGSEIQVFSPGATDPACIIPADGGTQFSCAGVAVPSGEGVSIRVAQLAPGAQAQHAAVRLDSLAPPVIAAASGGTLLTNGPIHGAGYPGARITVRTTAGSSCAFDADASGAWACVLSTVGFSGATTATAVQSALLGGQLRTSDASDAARLTIDTDKPDPPTLNAPEGSTTVPTGQRVTFAGGGDDGNLVTVYGGTTTGSFTLCRATIVGAAWSCLGSAVPSNTYQVVALQQDPAGNVSGPSAGITLVYSATTAPAAPHETSSPTPSAQDPAPTVPGAPGPGSSSPTPGNPGPGAVPPAGSGPQAWAGSTPFTMAVQSGFGAGSLPGWLRSAVLAFACLLLLLVPARLLGNTIAATRAAVDHRGTVRILGRNRRGDEFETLPTFRSPSRMLAGGAGLVAAAAVIALSVPVASQWAYLRLLPAVIIALVLVNAAAMVVPLVTASRVPSLLTSITFAPRALLLVAAAALASRLLELQPALLFGLIVALEAAAGTGTAQRGRFAAIQIASLTGLGLVAWLLLGVQAEPTGAASAFVAELGNIVVLASLGSAAMALIPIWRSPGRAIYAWSRWLWLGMSIAVFTALFAVLIPVGELWRQTAESAVIAAIVAGFAVVSISVWLWKRYVAPALR